MQKISKILLTTILIFITFTIYADLKTDFVFKGRIIPSMHASSLIENNKGELLCTFFGGIAEKSPYTSIWLSKRKNGIWSKPVEIANGKIGNERIAAWNPVLYKLNDNNLYLSYKIGKSPRKWEGYYKVSKDDGETWSEAIKYPDGVEGSVRCRSLILKDGRAILPSSTEFASWFGWRTRFEITDDNGKTWKVAKPPLGLIQTIQPAIIQHKDGTIQVFMRSRSGKIATTFSKDNAINWSPIELLNVDNPNSGLDAITLNDGTLAMICNPSNKDERKHISILTSKNGIDWTEALVLENPQKWSEFSYPSIIQTSDGTIHATYTWKRQSIKHVEFELKDLQK